MRPAGTMYRRRKGADYKKDAGNGRFYKEEDRKAKPIQDKVNV